MVTTYRLLAISSLLLLAASCREESANREQTSDTNNSAATANAATPVLADAPPSTAFPGAQLAFANVTSARQGDSAKVSFTFNVKNYELKSQTADTMSRLCNNSAQGQHIHFIIDNRPYVALYEPKHETTVPLNSEHYVLCFLSRSYHESIKEKGAAVLMHFKVDSLGKLQQLEVPKSPMVFYSRPKGDYLGKDTANVLLDYYLWNTTRKDEYTVRAEVRNETTGANATFNLTEWKPYLLQKLGTGKLQVMLRLVDNNGNPVEGPNTEISRGFQLAAQEPLK